MKMNIVVSCERGHQLKIKKLRPYGPLDMQLVVEFCSDCINQAVLEERHRMVELVKTKSSEFADALYEIAVTERKRRK